jgi:hypothetical protein
MDRKGVSGFGQMGVSFWSKGRQLLAFRPSHENPQFEGLLGDDNANQVAGRVLVRHANGDRTSPGWKPSSTGVLAECKSS